MGDEDDLFDVERLDRNWVIQRELGEPDRFRHVKPARSARGEVQAACDRLEVLLRSRYSDQADVLAVFVQAIAEHIHAAFPLVLSAEIDVGQHEEASDGAEPEDEGAPEELPSGELPDEDGPEVEDEPLSASEAAQALLREVEQLEDLLEAYDLKEIIR